MSKKAAAPKSPVRWIAAAVLLGLAGYAGYLRWRASKNLVTLHVRNAPLAEVMKSLRWQTWESFRWNEKIEGTVTLDVEKMPLEEVLDIIGDQTSSRWTAVYPIYKTKAALGTLDKALKGEIEMSKSSFTNMAGRGFGGPMRGGFGDTVLNQNKLVSLNFTNKDLALAANALSRFAQAQVLPENGLSAKIDLVLEQEEFDDAVAKVAKSAKRSWTKLYAFQPGRGGFAGGGPRGPGGPPGAGGPGEGGPRGPGMGGFGGPGGMGGRLANLTPEQREQMEKRQRELMETLPPEQRQEMQDRREAMQIMQSLPEEQRRQAMEARMNSPEMQQRMEQRMSSGIRNSTPEQRRERYERMHQMRKAREAGGQAPRR